MIFYSIYSWIFKSFKVNSDTILLKEFSEKGITKIMVIKRSWLFGLFSSWILISVGFLSAINVYITLNSIGTSTIGYTIVTVIVISFLLLVYSSISYLIKFRSIYLDGNVSKNIEETEQDLIKGDLLFISFFNQITMNIFVFGLIILVDLVLSIYTMYEVGKFETIGFSIANVLLLGFQMKLMGQYKKKMIDLEMDYNIVVPGVIHFINQSGMYGNSQTLNSEKIKTMSSKIGNIFQSFFNLGDIIILTEGDQQEGQMDMYYISEPKQTIKTIKELLEYKPKQLTNEYLAQVLEQLQISSDLYEKYENKELLRKYLVDNDQYIKQDYLSGSVITKSEIKEMYTLLSSK